jgi:hypothetical protein
MIADPLFHFFAITQTLGKDQKVVRIRTTQGLQTELTKMFEQQAEEFLDRDAEEIAFDGGYKVDDHEIFVIDKFPLSDDLASASKTPNQFEDIVLDSETTPSIKSILAASYDRTDNKPTVYFQAFSRSQLIAQKRFAISLHAKSTFEKLNKEVLILGTNLAAVFKDGKLYFRSFALINRFLDVKEYFKEATNEEILEVVGHAVLLAEDTDKLTKLADSWMRKRFAALQSSGILGQITARKTANKAKKYGFELEIKKKDGKDAIVFPSDKKKAKQLLTFLNEGFYQGELTDRLYQTNSQRVLPKAD